LTKVLFHCVKWLRVQKFFIFHFKLFFVASNILNLQDYIIWKCSEFHIGLHKTLILCQNFIPEKKNGRKSKRHKLKKIFPQEIMELVGVTIIECSQLKCIKPKMRGRKLRSVVQWQGALKQKGMKQVIRVFGYNITISKLHACTN